MLKIALREGWTLKNPFSCGEPLISLADETRRERVLNREEERRMLEACTGLRSHLRAKLLSEDTTGSKTLLDQGSVKP